MYHTNNISNTKWEHKCDEHEIGRVNITSSKKKNKIKIILNYI